MVYGELEYRLLTAFRQMPSDARMQAILELEALASAARANETLR